VSRYSASPETIAAVIVNLAHGASGNAGSMRPYVDGLHDRGIEARAISVPVGKPERAVEAYRSQVPDIAHDVIGGHSYGGRMASILATEERPAGLVLLSYPLHRPGHPEWETRVPHWRNIDCPVLLLSGESDPFARIDLLRQAVTLLPAAELVTYPGVGHGLAPVLGDALDRIATFARSVTGAGS
jgi:predicted alpha/beta-hydrolase family hydrolase